jgi:hypothetical protein
MLILFSLACMQNQKPIEYILETVDDFTLEDVNENSTSFGVEITTTDFPDKVSVWYFGHAT